MECWVDREGDGGGGMMKAASPPLSCPLLENGTTGGNFNPQRSASIQVGLAARVRARGPHSSLAFHTNLPPVSGIP